MRDRPGRRTFVGHRTYAPNDERNDVGGGGGGGGGPSLTGLVQWTKGDVGVTVTVPTRVAAVADQSGHGQDWQQEGNDPSNAPYILGDNIDGIPLITFALQGTGVATRAFDTAANFKDRNGIDMDGSNPRTVFSVIRPFFDPAFARTGGPLWTMNTWWSMFFLDPSGIFGPPSGAYAWNDRAMGGGVPNAFSPVAGGAGGPYDGTPTLTTHFSAGRPDLEFRINNVVTPLVPATMNAAAGAASHATLGTSSTVSFLGGYTEHLVYDYDLRTDVVELNKTIAYLRGRYPSIPL